MTDFTKNVLAAEAKLRKVFPPTPLQFSKYLSEKYEANVYLKREDLSPVRSYKIRGAYHFISNYLEETKEKKSDINFICASAGNHAQGLALSCSKFGVKGKIFMPVTTPHQKISRTKDFGGGAVELILVGDTYDQAAVAAKKFCKEKGCVYVPPYDHEWTIEGAGTVGAEIFQQLPQVDFIFVPVGGGGLSSGVSQFFAEKNPRTEVIGAEPLGAPSLTESLKLGKAVDMKNIDTFVDGAAVGSFGEKTLKILMKTLKRKPFLVPENRLCQTMLTFLHHDGIVLEPAGGLSIDALKDMDREEIKGKTIVCVVSGGNFDFERLPEIKERAIKYAGRKKYIILRLPQRPGAFKEFLNVLGPDDDISRFEYLKKSVKSFGSVLVGIETKEAKNFEALFKNLKTKGFEFTDVTEDRVLADFII